MIKKYLTLMLILPLIMSGCNQKDDWADLQQEVQQMMEEADGDFALAFKDLETGYVMEYNATEEFHAASTMKTPVMIEVYKQAAAGAFSFADSVLIKNEFKSIVDGSPYSLSVTDDSEGELYNMLGKKRTIADLTYDMIIVSSNLATNLVIELVDAKNVNQTMRDLGAKDINVLRGVEDIKAFEQGLSNTTTAHDLQLIFEKIAAGEVVNKESSDDMIDILLDQRFNDIIPAYLPERVKVAHKTGSITGVHHDSGIVFLPDGRKYVLVLLSKNLPDFDKGTELLARVSEKIYQHMTQ